MYNRLTTKTEHLSLNGYYPAKVIGNVFIAKAMTCGKCMNKYALSELLIRANNIYESIAGRRLLSEQPETIADISEIPSIRQYFLNFSADDFITDFLYSAKPGLLKRKTLMLPAPDACIQISTDKAWTEFMQKHKIGDKI